MLTCELIFGKFISEPEYEFDDCWRTKRVIVTEKDVLDKLKPIYAEIFADMNEYEKLPFLFSDGLQRCPAGYHFCSFGVLRKEN